MAAKFGIGTSAGIRAPLHVFVDRHLPAVADAAVRPRLWGVQRCAAPASPRHVPPVAGAPDRTN